MLQLAATEMCLVIFLFSFQFPALEVPHSMARKRREFQIDFSCSGPNHIEPCNIEEKASCFIKEKSFRSRESVFVSKSDNEFPERLIFSWCYILFLKQSDRSYMTKEKKLKILFLFLFFVSILGAIS